MTRRDKIGENAYSRYVMEVAWLYVKLNQTDMAQEYLDEVKMLDINHQGIQAFESLTELSGTCVL